MSRKPGKIIVRDVLIANAAPGDTTVPCACFLTIFDLSKRITDVAAFGAVPKEHLFRQYLRSRRSEGLE